MSGATVHASKPLGAVFTLALSAYASSASRAVSAVLMRLVLDSVAVGLINCLQVVATLVAPVTLGSVYGAMRAIPAALSEERTALVSRAFSAAIVEAAIVCPIAIAFSLPWLGAPWHQAGQLLAAVAYVFIYRLLAIQESLLLACESFREVVRIRLLRSLEPFCGVLGALAHATATAYIVASTFVAASGLALRRRLLVRPNGGAGQYIANAVRSTASDAYSFRLAMDRMLLTAANYIDPLIVAVVAGPGPLAGYYLGINIRGLLLNVPSAVFWQRWSGSVNAFEKHGEDRFTNIRFLLRLWLAVSVMLVAAVLVLWLATETILAEYRAYLAESVVAALVAVPITLSTMLRGRRMVDRKVGRLVVLSCVRLSIFGGGIALAHIGTPGGVSLQTIAAIAYWAVALECVLNSLDVSRAAKRWSLAAVTAALVLTPGVAILCWLAR